MKTTPIRSILIAGIAALCYTVPALAQDNAPSTPPATPTTSGQSINTPGTRPTASSHMQSSDQMGNTSSTAAQDKTFVMNAAEGSMAEITLSKLALRKSQNADVKSFAQKMIDDHTMLIANMKPLADQMGVQPPTRLKPEHQREAQRLRSMSGDDFDKEYITAMVADHHKDLGEFKTEKSTTANASLKATVAQGEQVVMQHTQMIDQMAQAKGISTPPMPSGL